MRKTRNSLGFTMAEMLIVVAIIAVLGGVVFIAVQSHQRSMAQLERNAIAKELFIAAQNHLTMAESEGYPVESAGGNYFGEPAGDTAGSDSSDADTETPVNDSDSSDGENTETESDKKITNVYYVIGPASGNILDQMLPFGSIDETVRAGGSYLIRYQTNPARVLDVFYVTTSGNPAKFNKDGGIKDSDYSDLMGKRDSLPSSGYVLGYYGGEEALESGDIILAPTVEVHNEERLTVTVTDNNNGNANLKLIVTGETSEAKMAITLTPTTLSSSNGRFSSITETNSVVYTVVLDDITTACAASLYDTNIKDGLHFADLNAFAGSEEKVIEFWQIDDATPTFKPGENIIVQAVSYSNTALTNIAYSSLRTTNSLFADSQLADVKGSSGTSTNMKAMIGNFRHLENLDAAVSGLTPTLTGPEETLVYTEVEQIVDLAKPETSEEGETDEVDLSWPGFVDAIKTVKGSESVNIYTDDPEDTDGTVANCYRPVDLTYALDYNGNHHKIESVKVDYDKDAGLFGQIGIAGSNVHDLELIDFSITTSEGNAGALIGKLVQKTSLDEDEFNVSNVVAYNTGNGTDATIKTSSGNAGGLIGQIVGDEAADASDKTAKAVVQKSAAALIVSATGGNAGGLIGTTSGGTVSGCYSGGHMKADTTSYDSTRFNVTATATGTGDDTTSGIAGGLIGDAGSTVISSSYSTCSATGSTVGGLIGAGSGAITSSYCTGLVKSTAATTVEGAFAGNWAYTSQADDDGNWYFEIINERDEKDESGNLTGGYTYLDPVPDSETVPGLTALDESAAQFNTFCGASSDWKTATPYNDKLKDYYGEGTGDARVAKYNLKTIEQLMGGTDPLKADDDDTTEYFVATHYGDWPAPEIFVINTAS